jgi:hypothetical protein
MVYELNNKNQIDMKTIFKMMIVLSIIGFVSCHKENGDYNSKGTIIGPDYRACMCCGGWIINIDNHQYLFNTLPNSTINLMNENFPLPVMLDWKFNNIGCSNTITIERIKKE